MKMFMMKRIVFGLCLLNCCLLQAYKEPFNLDYVFPVDMHGWLGLKNRFHLERLLKHHKPQNVVEVGTWLGVSAIFMTQFISDDSVLYCVDPWKPYPDMTNMPDCQIRMEFAYERFLSNCIHHGVTDVIRPMRMPSLEAAQLFEEGSIDFMYLDGSHAEEDVYNDILAWWPKLKKNGVMCGDDFGWPSVVRALNRVAPILQVKVIGDDNFWWFERN